MTHPIKTGARFLTLLSDFGSSDVYVGVMKGVIAQINPSITVVDLTHQIPAQNIAAGRFNLMNAYAYFPQGTVHVAVVDPGVGGARRAIAVEIAEGFLVGPDNGLLHGVLTQSPAIRAVELTNSRYWRLPHPSATFHGRDIFAPVGAYLASGIPLTELGSAIAPETLQRLPLPDCQATEQKLIGCIQHIDHFGNLITNIPSSAVSEQHWLVKVGDRKIPRAETYSEQPTGSLLALIGSHGWVEIAVNSGSAQAQLQFTWGTPVEVILIQE